MAEGCINPNATNYNSSADTEDYSCYYLISHSEDCHKFNDLQPVNQKDKSFTLSYSIKNDGGWVFFHDYMPDFYIHTREKLFNTKNNSIYKHNDGAAGIYHGTAVNPFFIDIIFNAKEDLLLETVNWISEFFTTTEQRFNTITHISIWNSLQHTGRIALDQLPQGALEYSVRRTQGNWSLNKFRDILKDTGNAFLDTLFNNYAIVSTEVATDKSWYDKKLLQDKWFCVRFEFDNLNQAKMVLQDTNVQVVKTDR